MSREKEIAAYFDLLEERIEFTETIFQSDHEEEAILLCSAFLDALANANYLDERQGQKNFVRLLCEYGNNPVFPQIHPLQVKYWLAEAPKGWKREVGSKLEAKFMEFKGSVYPSEQFIESVADLLLRQEADKLRKEIWHGSVASIVYTNLRCRAVHQLHVSPVSFGDTQFQGKPLPTMDYPFLKATLREILKGLRAYSIGTDKLFGHDFSKWRNA